MSEQKVVICKDLKSELQDFLSSLKYEREMFSLGRGYTGLSKGADSRDGSG